MKKRHHIEYALAMVLDKSLKAIVVVLTVISLLTLTGCATRGYVDRNCELTRMSVEETLVGTRIAAFDYASTIEDDVIDLKQRIMKTSDIRLQMYREDYLQKIESLQKETLRLRSLIEE